MRAIGAPGAALPRWVYPPAALGVVFVVVPLVGMAVKVDWSRFGALITSPDSRAALLLSLRTATMSTLLCLILGVPLALVLARHGGWLARVIRPLACADRAAATSRRTLPSFRRPWNSLSSVAE